jgi:hypothetical protein
MKHSPSERTYRGDTGGRKLSMQDLTGIMKKNNGVDGEETRS